MPPANSATLPRHSYRPGFPFALWALWAYLLVAIGRFAELIPGLADVPLAKLAIAACVLGLLFGRDAWSKRQILSHPLPRSALILVLLSGASILFSIWKSATLDFFFSSALVIGIGFALTAKLSADRRRLIATLYVLVLVASVQAVAALAKGGGRIYAGESYDPNDLAYLLVTVLPLTFAFVALSGTRLRRAGHVVLAGLYVIAILMTQSRGGLLGLVACVAYLTFFPLTAPSSAKQSGFRSGLWSRLAIVILAGGLAWIAIPSSTTERLSTVVSLGKDYNTDTTLVSGRMAIWERTIRATLRRPIGHGLNTSNVVDMQTGGVFKPSHNSLIQVFVELGFLGLVIFLRIYWLAWRALGQPLAGDIEATAFCRALRASLVANLVSGFFLSQAYSSLLWTIFAVITVASGTIAEVPPRRAGLHAQVRSGGR